MWETIGIIVLCEIVAALLLLLLRRVWPVHLRRDHNDLVGWQLSVLGTTYAVIVGFMLYAVWTNFRAADVNVEMEANCLVQVVRQAQGLPQSQQKRVDQLARDYAEAMISQEWPAMSHNRLSVAGTLIARQLWKTIAQTDVKSPSQSMAMERAFNQIDSMLEHRRMRQLQSQAALPGILWAVLITGGVITVLSSFLFHTESFSLHATQALALTLLISLVLLAIGDLNRPFQGWVHVSASGFRFAIERIQVLTTPSP